MSRVWKCPECGYEELWSYESLATKGEPVCSECGTDMKLKKRK
jgi:uncharacterized protein (DUF983 family)